jgi:broad specificity phosphatase PhoE
MITTIYLIRHSKNEVIEDSIGDTLQEKNENTELSQEGHSIIENISKNNELKNIDVIYSSNYKRAFQTAEHIAKENNLNIIVDKRFGERKFGISSWDEKPKDFEIRQFSDENFKTPNGECIKEVQKRMYEAINDILNKHKGKKVVVLSHGTASLSLLKKWCEVSFLMPIKFNDKEIFDGKFNYCETFKLTFDNDKLINIENIKYK